MQSPFDICSGEVLIALKIQTSLDVIGSKLPYPPIEVSRDPDLVQTSIA